jgi:hypothetical protein
MKRVIGIVGDAVIDFRDANAPSVLGFGIWDLGF